MVNDYLPLFLLFIVALAIAFIAVGLGVVFGPRRPTKIKSEPYESGIVPFGPGRRRISVKYYLVAVLFILFDIEVVIFLPWAVAFREAGMKGFVVMLVFAFILEVAFVYAWKKGAMEWE
ncbi:MAG: NADH-quinone oxidoreductase subunit A [Chloroflexi bacterium]|nr:NADH-quinone oxidoreductase subunit A [Chloroflexota bacterium]